MKEQMETKIQFKETVITKPSSNMMTEQEEDIFLMRAPKIVGRLLRQCNGNASVALHRLKRHMNRIGDNGINMPALKIAKLKLEELSQGIRKKF